MGSAHTLTVRLQRVARSALAIATAFGSRCVEQRRGVVDQTGVMGDQTGAMGDPTEPRKI